MPAARFVGGSLSLNALTTCYALAIFPVALITIGQQAVAAGVSLARTQHPWLAISVLANHANKFFRAVIQTT